jgi:hypothetical protein
LNHPVHPLALRYPDAEVDLQHWYRLLRRRLVELHHDGILGRNHESSGEITTVAIEQDERITGTQAKHLSQVS